MSLTREERQALNELFGGQEISDEWLTKFPELGWDENVDIESLDQFTDRINDIAEYTKDDEDYDDTNHNYQSQSPKNNRIMKSDDDIKLSTKAIILKKYKAFNKEDNHQFLIMKDSGSDYWDLPGGHLEDGETSLDGLERELNEESGLDLKRSCEIFIKQITLGKEHKPVMFYFADASGNIELSDEHTDYEWITLDEIDNYNLGVFADILEEAFEMLYDGKLEK